MRNTPTESPIHTYTGRRFDEETGLYYYRYRYYDSQLGRFISRDPIVYQGSKWNLYEYVKSNSVGYIDPLGMVVLQPGPFIRPVIQQPGPVVPVGPFAHPSAVLFLTLYEYRNQKIQNQCSASIR
jgi:RHS repeat-associated protein